MIISGWILLKIKSLKETLYRNKKNSLQFDNFSSENRAILDTMQKKYDRSGHATDESIIW